MKIALIGFGEAGQMFAEGLRARANVYAYDIKITDVMQKVATTLGVTLSSSVETVMADAKLILSLVTADQAAIAARCAMPFISADQLYLEMNSVAPKTKQLNAKLIPSLVDVAIMAPVHPKRMSVPLLVAHPNSDKITGFLNELGFNAKSVGADVGHASAIKMCRSIMIKGMEALTIECLSTARYFGVESDVLASLHSSFPEMGWDRDRADYWFGRVALHGQRRAAEMREVAKTVADAGVLSEMALEVSKTQAIYAGNISYLNIDRIK